jgi:porin
LSIDPFTPTRSEISKKTPSNSSTLTSLPEASTNAGESRPDNQIPTATPETTAQQSAKAPPAPLSNDGNPPYSYVLFLDVDYINKFSGGASSNPMSDNPDAVPSPTAAVALLHFYGEYDTARADLWRNGMFVLHMIYGTGTSPTGTVGDLRSVSNIDASFMSNGEMVMPGLDLLEFWYEHAFPASRSSIRFGVGYLSSDFYKSKYTGLFLTSGINSIGTEILWNTMASNPPNTTIGLWYKTKLTDKVYGQAVAFDGLPDHSTNFFDVKFDADEGVFLATELGWLTGEPKQKGYFKAGFGYWYLSQRLKENMMVGIPDYPGDPIGTRGYYTVIDKAFGDQLGLFFKGGMAVNGINKYRRYFTTGASYKGLIPSRPNDTAGVAIVQSKLSDNYVNMHGINANGKLTTYTEETIYEITYSIPVNKWLMLQPDLQYVMQPGMNIMNQNAVVGILRAEISLL